MPGAEKQAGQAASAAPQLLLRTGAAHLKGSVWLDSRWRSMVGRSMVTRLSGRTTGSCVVTEQGSGAATLSRAGLLVRTTDCTL